MKCNLRTWRLSDAQDLARLLSNRRILNNLRDGLPYLYTEQVTNGIRYTPMRFIP